MLGTDFISDVLLVRLKVEAPATLQPQFLATQIALRTVAEALTIAAAHHLDIEATELQAEYRPALTPHGQRWAGGGDLPVRHAAPAAPGFTRRIHEARPEDLRAGPGPPGELPRRLRRVLLPLPAQLPEPVRARAARPARRRQPAALPAVTARCPRCTRTGWHAPQDRLYEDLKGLGIPGVTFTRNADGRASRASARSRRRSSPSGAAQQWIIGVHGPLTRDVAPDAKLQEAKEFSTSVPVLLIDDTEITHNLPSASNRVIGALG